MQYKKYENHKCVGVVEENELPHGLIAMPKGEKDYLVSKDGWKLYFEEVA